MLFSISFIFFFESLTSNNKKSINKLFVNEILSNTIRCIPQQKILPDVVFTLFRLYTKYQAVFQHTFYSNLPGLFSFRLKQFLVNIYHHKNQNFSPRFGTVTQKITSYKNDIINRLMFEGAGIVYKEKKTFYSMKTNTK